MARRNRDDDLLMEEDELTAAFLGEEDLNPVPADDGGAQAMPGDEWDEDEAQLPGQLAVDVYETKERLVVKARTAGVNKNDLDVSISDNTLTVRGTLSAGTNQVSQGGIWNDFGHAESRLVTGPGDFASTWTTTGGGDSFVSGALAFIEVPPEPPYDSGFYIDGQTEQVLASSYGRTLLYNDGQGNFFKIEES